MRTTLSELRLLEDYVQRRLAPEDRLLVEARLLIEDELQERLSLQQHCYRLVRAYGRDSVREQLQRVEQEIFTQSLHKRFVQKIKQYFG